jgi:hypothetical protein
MARGDITCPIDGLVLTLPVFSRLPDDPTALVVGEHVHVTVSANGVCANGHRWVIESGDILYRRIV